MREKKTLFIYWIIFLLCVFGTIGYGLLTGTERENKMVQEDTGSQVSKTVSTDGTYAIIVKSDGNLYNEREAEGFQQVIEEAGGECRICVPRRNTPEAQIELISECIKQEVDAIAIAANSPDKLQKALRQAMKMGIRVVSLDSAVNADSREIFINQARTDVVGRTLMDSVLDIAGEGEWAILSSTAQATNQNTWIARIKEEMVKEEYKDLELVDIAYGMDEYDTSKEETRRLLTEHPNLKLICAPTTAGIRAAAEVIREEGADVKITGLGLPSEMVDYIGKECPYMFLWNPIEIGQLAAYASIGLVNEEIKGEEGEVLDAGALGTYRIYPSMDGGTEIILGPLFEFNKENIKEWREIY